MPPQPSIPPSTQMLLEPISKKNQMKRSVDCLVLSALFMGKSFCFAHTLSATIVTQATITETDLEQIDAVHHFLGTIQVDWLQQKQASGVKLNHLATNPLMMTGGFRRYHLATRACLMMTCDKFRQDFQGTEFSLQDRPQTGIAGRSEIQEVKSADFSDQILGLPFSLFISVDHETFSPRHKQLSLLL